MIKLTNVSKTYPTGTHALKNVDLTIDDKEFVFVVGPSGAGKSTLLKLLLLEEKPSEGQIEINGFNLNNIKNRQIPYLRRTMGIVFQDFRLIPNMTAYDNIAFSLRATNAPRSVIRSKVPYMLELVGLESKSKRMPHELSGGEQQRIALARALVNNPKLIIADEPTGNVDPERSFEIIELLQEINQHGPTILMVTHEHDLVKKFNKRVVKISGGEIVSDEIGGGLYEY
ncbi:MAG: cell division ATP-binding protein FtsE [Clostridia bacterium]